MTITFHPFLILAAICFIIANFGTVEWISGINVTLWISGGLLSWTLHGMVSFDRPPETK